MPQLTKEKKYMVWRFWRWVVWQTWLESVCDVFTHDKERISNSFICKRCNKSL